MIVSTKGNECLESNHKTPCRRCFFGGEVPGTVLVPPSSCRCKYSRLLPRRLQPNKKWDVQGEKMNFLEPKCVLFKQIENVSGITKWQEGAWGCEAGHPPTPLCLGEEASGGSRSSGFCRESLSLLGKLQWFPQLPQWVWKKSHFRWINSFLWL